jgi:hypothetical protein
MWVPTLSRAASKSAVEACCCRHASDDVK